MTRSHAFYLLVVAVIALVGCSDERAAEDTCTANVSYEEAMEAYQAGDAQTAVDKLSAAITAGLDPDQFGSAIVHRAVCYAKLGDFEKAKADLDRAAGGAPNEDEIHAARSYLLAKQGKQAESDKEWRMARRLNSAVTRFED